MSENRVLRIFGPKREKMSGGWRRLHTEELHNLYASPNIIREIKSGRVRWAGYVACIREMRNAYKILVGKLEEKRPFGRPRCRCEDNIRMDLREIDWEIVDWIHLDQDRDEWWWALLNTVMNLRVP
jgi:hypothetical protein